MQPDDLRLKDTQDWLARSDEDLRNAEHDLTAVPPFVRDALFHAQQAVEKACKGFLAWHDQPFPKIPRSTIWKSWVPCAQRWRTSSRESRGRRRRSTNTLFGFVIPVSLIRPPSRRHARLWRWRGALLRTFLPGCQVKCSPLEYEVDAGWAKNFPAGRANPWQNGWFGVRSGCVRR